MSNAKDPGNYQLEEVLFYIKSYGSIRLYNCLSIAITANRMPYATVQDYLSDAKALRLEKLLRIPNLGKKTADEFDKLIAMFAEEKGYDRQTAVSHDKRIWTNDAPWAALSEVGNLEPGRTEIEEILPYCRSYGSIRLYNCLVIGIAGGKMPYATVQEYLSDAKGLRLKKLLRIPSLGRKTASEFDKLVTAFAEDKGYDLKNFDSHDKLDQPSDTSRIALSDDGYWERKITDRFVILSKRERDILERRFGIGRDKEQTLEEVGDEYDLTRERIRQIQSKALRKLRSPYVVPLWEDFLSQSCDQLVEAIFGSSPVIKKPRKVCGELAIAVAVVYETANKFLEQKAIRVDGFWVRPNIDSLELKRARNLLISHIREYESLPQSLADLSEVSGTSRRLLEAAVSTLKEYSQYDGWVVEGRVTSRKKRIVNILNLFHQSHIRSLVPLWDLKVAYWERYSDKCSGRDLLICLQEHKAHFLNLRELGWLCLTAQSGNKQLETAPKLSYDLIPDELFKKPVKTGTGLANSVYELFEKHGPLRLSRAAELFKKEYTKYSVTSMYPMLVSYAVFLRFAPGVHGIQSHLRDPKKIMAARQLLFSGRDVDLYLLSRIAGPPGVKFPLWDPIMERHWAEWLNNQGDHDRLGCLLESVDLRHWDLTATEQEKWEEIRRKIGRHINSPEIRLFSQRRIDVGILTTALAAASVNGFVNWMYLNQALGWRVQTTRVGLVLALLVRIGALKPTGVWTEPHILTNRGREIGALLIRQQDYPVESLLGIFKEPNYQEPDYGWANQWQLEEILQQVVEFSANSDDDIDVDEGAEYDDDLAYDGLMGEALRLLIEGE